MTLFLWWCLQNYRTSRNYFYIFVKHQACEIFAFTGKSMFFKFQKFSFQCSLLKKQKICVFLKHLICCDLPFLKHFLFYVLSVITISSTILLLVYVHSWVNHIGTCTGYENVVISASKQRSWVNAVTDAWMYDVFWWNNSINTSQVLKKSAVSPIHMFECLLW